MITGGSIDWPLLNAAFCLYFFFYCVLQEQSRKGFDAGADNVGMESRACRWMCMDAGLTQRDMDAGRDAWLGFEGRYKWKIEGRKGLTFIAFFFLYVCCRSIDRADRRRRMDMRTDRRNERW